MTENKMKTPPSKSNKITISHNLQNWILIGTGGICLLIALLLALSFILTPRQQIQQIPVKSRPVREILPPQVIYHNDFNDSQLTGWVVDWVNLYEAPDGNGNVLMAYRNMLEDKRFPIKFTPIKEKVRIFYAKSSEIPVHFKYPYRISFDFHGKGPIELVDFGHIRLRLMDILPRLSYDPDGNNTYNTFQLPSWNTTQLEQEIHSFQIEVDPKSQNYEITIDDKKIAKVHFSDELKPIKTIYFHQVISSTGTGLVNAVYYDNFEIYGTPTHKLEEIEKGIPQTLDQSTPGIFREYSRYYQAGWDKFNSREYDEAIIYFNKATELNPDSAEAYNALGVTYRALGNTTAAWQAWIKSLSIDSTYEQARKNLGMN